MLCPNGYPEHLVSQTLSLRESWPRETLKAVLRGVQQDVEKEKNEDYFEVLHAPYVRGFSESLQRKLRKVQIGFVPKKRETLYTQLCKLKQKVNFEDCKDVVYSVPCVKCGLRYMGETGQHFNDRRKQHERDVRNKKSTSGLYMHSKRGEGHVANWEKVVYVEREKHWMARKVKEAILINAVNPTKKIEADGVLNLEKGYEVDPIWSGFNEDFRAMLEEKFK